MARKQPISELLDAMPPAAEESERALLGAALVAGKINPDVTICAEDFYTEENRVLFATMANLDAEHGQFEVGMLLPILKAKKVQDFNWAAYLGELTNGAGAPQNARYHAQQIRQAYVKRTIGEEALQIFRESRNGGIDAVNLRTRFDRMLNTVSDDGKTDVAIGGLISRTMDTVAPQKLTWLWRDKLPFGKYVEVIGNPGAGKSVMLLDLMARTTRGLPCPDCDVPMGPGGVVLMTTEDDPADTIRPRLDAAGADVSRVRIVDAVGWYDGDTKQRTTRCISLDRDIPALEEAIKITKDCRMVVIDPTTAYCGKIDSHKSAEVRALITPLAALAQKYQVVIVGITHFNKNTNGPAITRGMGSMAWVAAARMAWAVAKDPNDPTVRLLVPIKCNLAKDAAGLSYKLIDVDGVPRIAWSELPVTTTIDEIMAASAGNRKDKAPRRQDVKVWLSNLLVNGRIPASDGWAAADEAGYSEKLVRWAQKQMGIIPYQEGFGKGCTWYWQLPGTVTDDCTPLENTDVTGNHWQSLDATELPPIGPKTASDGQ